MAPQASTDPRVTPAMSLIAGGIAGGIESTLTYPFEFAKTRVQLRTSSNLPTPRNPFTVITNVVKNEGLRALYLGCSTLVAGTILKDGIRFLTFDYVKSVFKDENGKLSAGGSLAAGVAAGVMASTFAVTPTERIKTALIDDSRNVLLAKREGRVQERQFRGAVDACRVLVRQKGWVQGLYAGYVSTTVKQAGTTSVRMGSYSILKEAGLKYGLPQNGVTSFVLGMGAGIITAYTTQPVDVIKTRAQSVKGEGIVEAAKGIMAEKGIRGFWAGTTMRLGRTVTAGGILFTAYEQVVKVLMPIMGQEVNKEGQPV